MSSTYSTNLALELIGTGDQAGTWGTTTNNNLGTLLEQAIGGYTTQTITDGADTILTMSNGASCTARNMMIELTGILTATRTLVVPNSRKLYFIYNHTSGGYGVTVKTSAGAGVLVRNGQRVALFCDAANDVVAAVNGLVAPATIISSGPNTVLQVTQQSGAGAALSVSGNSVFAANSSTDAVRINQLGGGNALLVEDETNPDATPFAVTGNGLVLVGQTANIDTPASITSAFLQSRVQISSFTPQQFTYQASDTVGPVQYFQKSRGTSAAPTAVVTGDALGGIYFAGWDASATSRVWNSAAMVVTSTGTIGVNQVPGQFAFQVNPNNGTTLVNQFIINGAGVCIGTAAPSTLEAVNLSVSKDLSGAISGFSVRVRNAVQSSVTNYVSSFSSSPSLAAAATLANMQHFVADNPTVGAGATLTYQAGFTANALSSATSNDGFVSLVDANIGGYGFKAVGTANNLFLGNTRIGSLFAPTATLDVAGNIVSGGASASIGYGTGAGGTVNQAGSRTTGVSINKICGQITLVNANSTAFPTYQTFTVTNSTVAATDVIILNQTSGALKYIALVTNVAAGSFQISVASSTGTTAEAPVFNFAVIKGVTA